MKDLINMMMIICLAGLALLFYIFSNHTHEENKADCSRINKELKATVISEKKKQIIIQCK